MKKIIICVILVNAFSITLISQNKIDVKDVFKMQFFLNKRVCQSEEYFAKNNKTYELFSNSFNINIDTLKVYNNINGFDYNEFDFYLVGQDQVQYFNNNYNVKFGILGYYILCINNKTGTLYRLAGFDSNDFYSFLLDFQRTYETNNMKKLTLSRFLKKFKVEKMDFLCIHNELKKQKRKEPLCLMKNEDPISIW